MTRFPAAGLNRRQLKYRESSRQVHTYAPLAATQVNNCTHSFSYLSITQYIRFFFWQGESCREGLHTYPRSIWPVYESGKQTILARTWDKIAQQDVNQQT